MKKIIRKILMCILCAVFLASSALVLRQWKDNAGGEETYADAMNLALSAPKTEQSAPQPQTPTEPAEAPTEPVTRWVPVPVENDPAAEELQSINLQALREVNPDVLGWIRIPDTKIDYPLMQGEDNDFYLKHTWDKQPNSVGSIFMEHLSSSDLTDYNTIIYGHNMKNGSMFGKLPDFSVQKHWETHPYVYLLTDAGVYRYEIFAFYLAEVDSLTYSLNPEQEGTKAEFLKLATENNRINTGIVPALTDRILTLSTCSGGSYANRYVVQARLPMMEVTE